MAQLYTGDNNRASSFMMIDNYIYLYHLKQFIVIPGFADSVTDQESVSFGQTSILSRSAPIFSYQNSGPRTIQVQFNLHRDMMTEINYKKSNLNLEIGDDYVDTIIKLLKSMALPEYGVAEKMVNPPIVALRMGQDIFIKGVINGGVSVTYKYPIIRDPINPDLSGKYSNVDLSFNIAEVDPYTASDVAQLGSFRGLNKTLERNLWKAV